MPAEPPPDRGLSEEPAEAEEAEPGVRAEPRAAAEPAGPAPLSEQLWTDVLSTGLSLLEKLAGAAAGGRSGAGGGTPAALLPSSMIARDEPTGRPYLKLPLPEPEIIQKLADLLAAFGRRQ
jgi:hypothetical protein